MHSELNPDYWSFTLGGLVDIPLCLSYTDLQVYAFVEQACILSCSGSSTNHVAQSHWQGAALADLLAEVQVQADVRYAHLYAADGYTTCVEFSDLTNAMLAYECNGQPLTTEQGFPVRLIVPGLFGYKMPKHVQHILLSHQPLVGFWEKRGWELAGRIVPTAAFLTPHDQAIISGHTSLQGIAYAGDDRVDTIEVNVDDGPWMPVPIPNPSSQQITHWSIDWQPPGIGIYRLQVRVRSSQTVLHHKSHTIIVQVRSA